MHIAVLGTGYVGLVTAACLAEYGAKVSSYDTDAAKIACIASVNSPFYEPGLNRLLVAGLASDRLSASIDLASSVREADIVFITVGTPSLALGHADTSAVFVAAKSVVPFLRHDTVVAIKSTVPVGTCRKIAAMIRSERPGLRVHVASNPEFLREGQAITDFFSPDRIVIGADSRQARHPLHLLYASKKALRSSIRRWKALNS